MALREGERVDDVSMAGVPLLVAVAAASALEYGDVLLPVRLVGDRRCAERDLDPRREAPEAGSRLRVVRAVSRVRRALVADENEPAGGREGGVIAVADARHLHGPRDLVGGH